MVLTNPRYMGKRAYHGEIVADSTWPAIVDESTWRAANAVLNDPSRRRVATRAKYLLTGLATCAVCGSTVHAGGNARQGVPGYRCSGSLGHFARRSEPIDEYVETILIEKLSLPDARTLLSKKGPDAGALQLEAIGIRERLDSLASDFADGALTSSQLRIATEKLRSRLSDVEGALADSGRVDVLGSIVNSIDVKAAWGDLATANKRAAIDLLFAVQIHPVGKGKRTFDPASVTVTARSQT
jgi:hypothetical protein